MTTAYQIESICEVFSAACEQFEFLVHALHGERTARMEHGDIETLICRMGTELMRLLMQGHLDLRAAREVRRHDLTGADGSALSHCRPNRSRDLMSVFGQVRVKRRGYGCAGAGSVFPLDGELNLPPDKYSHGLRRRVAEEVAGHSFDEAVADIAKTTGGKVPKRQVEQIAVAVLDTALLAPGISYIEYPASMIARNPFSQLIAKISWSFASILLRRPSANASQALKSSSGLLSFMAAKSRSSNNP
jgi:hypothetical protein